MTQPADKKPRWRDDPSRRTPQRPRVSSGELELRREVRGAVAGSLEHRLSPAVATVLAGEDEWRDATAAPTGGPSTQEIIGTVIQYGSPYAVSDAAGEYMETIMPSVGAILLSNPDVRLLVDHDSSRLLARTKSGTLTLADSPTGLQMRAALDTRDSDAMNALVRIGRGDLSQQSCSFRVARDVWSPDYSQRTIHAFEALYDCALVAFPASPSTVVALAKKKPWPEGGVDGTQMGPYPVGGIMSGDGTGSRTAQKLQKDLAVMRTSRKLQRDLERMRGRGRSVRIRNR